VHIASLILASVGLLAWLLPLLEARLARWRPTHLADVPADGLGGLPRLSVIVPALNEEATIKAAMRSLLAVDYPDLEVIAVDDRSTDRTGAILDRLASSDPRMRVVHVRELPPGWLGKNHALQVGGQAATGEFILFTDADVHFEPTALRRAVRHAEARGLDHLVVFPEMETHGFWETLMVWFFAVMFSLKFRPWKVCDPRSKAYMGVGAFNLVRAEVYRRAGGHAALPMDVTDDMKLGKVMKQAGGRAEIVFGMGFVRVRWVVGLTGIVHGLTKNAYAGYSFRPVPAAASLVGLAVMAVWPPIGLFVGSTVARLLCAGAVLVPLYIAYKAPPKPGASPLYALAFPMAALVLGYIILRSMVVTYRQGGVVWRGTLYPLEELRRGVV
jgi:glycosyltransferase involved in cell wall biosynthesis